LSYKAKSAGTRTLLRTGYAMGPEIRAVGSAFCPCPQRERGEKLKSGDVN